MIASKARIYLKKHRLVLAIFCFALLFRLIIATFALNGDLLTQAEWGNWMYKNGPKGLYDWNKWLNEWPNHPPLITLVYLWTYQLHSFIMMILSNIGTFIALHRLAPTKFMWLYNFIQWYGSAHYQPGNFLQGIVFTIKVEMILADLVIGAILYYLCRLAKVPWKKYVIYFLFLPFSWYLSSLWGQSDQLAFIFLILSFLLLYSPKSLVSPLIFAIAINLKPTGLILAPLYLWIWYRQRLTLRNLIIGATLALLFTYCLISLFTTKPPIEFFVQNLYPRLFLSKTPFTTVSAFNFWYIFHAKDLVSETTKYFYLSAKTWGYLFFAIISYFSFSQVRYRQIASAFAAIFVSGFGGWLFLTNMYERYLFAGLVSLLFLSIYKTKYFKYFILLSTIYLFNMYNGWWFPQSFTFLKDLFLWNHRLLTRFMSLVNLIIYIKIIYSLRSDLAAKH